MTIKGQMSLILRTSETILKKEFQKCCSLGESTNIWPRLQG